MDEKELRDLVGRSLETERKARAEKKRQIAAIYAEIAAADTKAVGLAFQRYAKDKSQICAAEIEGKALTLEALDIYGKLCEISCLEWEC